MGGFLLPGVGYLLFCGDCQGLLFSLLPLDTSHFCSISSVLGDQQGKRQKYKLKLALSFRVVLFEEKRQRNLKAMVKRGF